MTKKILIILLIISVPLFASPISDSLKLIILDSIKNLEIDLRYKYLDQKNRTLKLMQIVLYHLQKNKETLTFDNSYNIDSVKKNLTHITTLCNINIKYPLLEPFSSYLDTLQYLKDSLENYLESIARFYEYQKCLKNNLPKISIKKLPEKYKIYKVYKGYNGLVFDLIKRTDNYYDDWSKPIRDYELYFGYHYFSKKFSLYKSNPSYPKQYLTTFYEKIKNDPFIYFIYNLDPIDTIQIKIKELPYLIDLIRKINNLKQPYKEVLLKIETDLIRYTILERITYNHEKFLYYKNFPYPTNNNYQHKVDSIKPYIISNEIETFLNNLLIYKTPQYWSLNYTPNKTKLISNIKKILLTIKTEKKNTTTTSKHILFSH